MPAHFWVGAPCDDAENDTIDDPDVEDPEPGRGSGLRNACQERFRQPRWSLSTQTVRTSRSLRSGTDEDLGDLSAFEGKNHAAIDGACYKGLARFALFLVLLLAVGLYNVRF